ncbi:MAG: hypothetical protein LBG76_00950 [Treponema sp.]|jgi:hypothetical protein|nr:hypothetical protein [Treponema sp.]
MKIPARRTVSGDPPLADALKYSFYVMIHPLDGFWDLTHEKRGSLFAAHVIVAAGIVVEMLRLTLTSFQFITVYLESFNAITVALGIIAPLALWTVANWGLTTLWDGKGRLHEIYMGTAYALTPSVIINAGMIVLSRFLSFQEGAIYYLLAGLSVVWTGLLILSAMMMIHSYTLGKTLISSFFAVIGMGVIIFIFVIFFSLISDGIAFFVFLAREIMYRVS